MCRAETVERSLGRKTINVCFIPFLPHAADQQMVSDGDELLHGKHHFYSIFGHFHTSDAKAITHQ